MTISEAVARLKAPWTPHGHTLSEIEKHTQQFFKDADVIVAAYLAEHDQTPIDQEWLRSVGFTFGHKWTNGFGYCELSAETNTITVSMPSSGDWSAEEWVVGGERVPHGLMPFTRGDVRRLLNALGIPSPKGATDEQ